MLGCPTFSSHSDWCTVATAPGHCSNAGRDSANPLYSGGRAGSKQLWGRGWRERQKQVMSTCMLPGTDSLFCLCSQRLRTTRQATAPSLKDQVLLDQTPLNSSCLHLVRPQNCISRNWGARGGPLGPSPAPVLSPAPCGSSTERHIQHVIGSSSLSDPAGLPAEEWETFPLSDHHAREPSPRALCLGEKPLTTRQPLLGR